jgi:hypothetical protein
MAGNRVIASQPSMTSDQSTSTMAGAKMGLLMDMDSRREVGPSGTGHRCRAPYPQVQIEAIA